MIRSWAAATILFPTLVGGILFVAIETGVLPGFLWTGTVAVDLAALLLWGGILTSSLIGAGFAWQWRRQRQYQAVQRDARAEQELERRRFLRRLDHELKNPLLIIRLAVENLQQSTLSLPTDQRESLERLLQQSQRLQKLVEGLRMLAELGEVQPESEQVALAEVLAEAVALCNNGQENRSWVTVNLQQVPWPLGAIRGDRDLLVMAFHNLLDNARKFSGDEGRVEVRATEDGGMAVVEIADTGVGIPLDDVVHIFGELYRAQNASGVPGSGLGLALVERIVERHGGVIRVRSRLDQGTVVSVRLPLA